MKTRSLLALAAVAPLSAACSAPLTARSTTARRSKTRQAASYPPSGSKVIIPPKPDIWLFAIA